MRHLVITSLLVASVQLAPSPVMASSGPGIVALPDQPEAPFGSLESADGCHRSIRDYSGYVALVNFWAEWCGPCVAELPALAGAHRRLKSNGVVVLAINAGDPAERVRRYLERNPLPFPVLLDPNNTASAAWQVQSLPTTYVVTPDGRIYGGAVGARQWDSEAMLAELRQLAISSGARADRDDSSCPVDGG